MIGLRSRSRNVRMFKRTCNRLYHDKDARRNLREAQMTWGLRVTDGAINTFL